MVEVAQKYLISSVIRVFHEIISTAVQLVNR